MFISVEGGEGSGKTTLIRNLAEYLESKGDQVLITREPGGTRFGESLRKVLLDPEFPAAFNARAEMLLFLAARVQHIEEVIQPALRKGKTVICDRFNDSTIAYQGGGRELGVVRVEQLCFEVCDGFQPDKTFVLDINPETAFQRLNRSKDRMEKESFDFHNKVRSAFYALKDKHPNRIHLINADQSKEKVLADVLKYLQ
ncbi:Thymidylate kinase [Waddlia chondrophila 2032/99]|nr:Thymidylate kinase [Waddlia chondrophila 2032/99]